MLSTFLVGVPYHLLLETHNGSVLILGSFKGVAVLIQGHCKSLVPISLPLVFHKQERTRNEMCFLAYQTYEGSCY